MGCTSSHDNKNLQCNEVRFIDGFPKEVELGKPTALPLDLSGCVDVFAIDSLMVFKSAEKDFLWTVYSLNSLKPIKQLLRRGHGHDEFFSLPSCEFTMRTDSALYCDFWRSSDKAWYRCDLTKTLEQDSVVWSGRKNLGKYGNVCDAYALTDTSFFLIKYKDYTGFKRNLCINGVMQELTNIGNLNEVSIKNDINTLSAVRCVNRERMKVAEGMLRLNQINLYSLLSGNSLTLCVGDELSDVNGVDDRPRNLRHEFYGMMQSYDDYFVALYQDVSAIDYWLGKGTSQLQFFDWEGRPLLCMDLPFMATSFFIHQNRYVYVFSSVEREEALYRYDCGKYLEAASKRPL